MTPAAGKVLPPPAGAVRVRKPQNISRCKNF
nr:MAG TPA: hypothetical protein [Caudoviricetes sp.]